jgi:hypothetical protein
MNSNYVNSSRAVCGTDTDHRTLPEAELWTQVILQAINDLDGRTSLTPRSAKDSAREWIFSECDGVCSFLWTCQIIDVDPNFIRSQLAKKQRMKNRVEVIASMAKGAKALRRKDLPLPANLDPAEGRPNSKRIAAYL